MIQIHLWILISIIYYQLIGSIWWCVRYALHLEKHFDVIISNPPYIPTYEIKNLSDDVKNFEPKLALDGGKDGLDVIKKVIYKSRYILKSQGLLALEIGNGQYFKVSQILKNNFFRTKYLIKDFKNNIRCIISELNF